MTTFPATVTNMNEPPVNRSRMASRRLFRPPSKVSYIATGTFIRERTLRHFRSLDVRRLRVLKIHSQVNPRRGGRRDAKPQREPAQEVIESGCLIAGKR